jgi:hypothetical protein
MTKLLAAVLGAFVVLAPGLAGATTVGVTPPVTVIGVNVGPGDQTDPHVSGDWTVYSDFSSGTGRVRYHNIVTDVDAEIPSPDGGSDSLSDISATTAVFVRFAGGSHSVWSFDVAAGGTPVELDPHAASNRREAAVGGRTVAWQDFGFDTTSSPEIVVYDLDTHATARLTTDSLYDRDPAVSPDGNTVTWSKCTTLAGGCEVWAATRTGTTWAERALTAGGTESTLPDTNGQVAVYNRSLGFDESDVVWQPVGGGPEGQLTLPSIQQNPSISGDVVVFESYDPAASTPNFDLYAYDLLHDRLFRLTDTPEDESLNDVSVAPDGTATVVWSRHEATGDDDVLGERFVVPGLVPGPTMTASVQPPINADGSSAFNAKRGVIPLKFTLTAEGTPTCDLPPASLTVARIGESSSEPIDESLYSGTADGGSSFRVTDCQYQYNLGSKNLGPGTYLVGIVVDGQQRGTAVFTLK